jgi:hypothetical protein
MVAVGAGIWPAKLAAVTMGTRAVAPSTIPSRVPRTAEQLLVTTTAAITDTDKILFTLRFIHSLL